MWYTRIRIFLAVAVAFWLLPNAAFSQDVTLRLHHFLPPQAVVPANFLRPWAEKLKAESEGRITVEIYPAMQLGGRPPALYDQVRDGVVDIVWTLPGYSPGRFPKTEVFELPFMPASAEATSKAAWAFYEMHLRDEYGDVKVLAVHVHGPGLIHTKGEGIAKLEDMRGKKLRGPTRMVNRLIEKLGAVPVGMPVPTVPEALTKGVIDGTVIPWEVTLPLKIAEIVSSHTEFTGDRGLYTAFFVLAMNKAKYEALPDDLKAVIDKNSGMETAAWLGRVMDEGDGPAKNAAENRGNKIITLNNAETERWKAASGSVVIAWIKEMSERGFDGTQLYQDAQLMISTYAE